MGASTSKPSSAAPAAANALERDEKGEVIRGKSGKKICCSCPETKKARDLCVVENGEERCQFLIEAHKACLRSEGFRVE